MISKAFRAEQKKAVKRGVAWLDEKIGPRWPFLIELKTLNIRSLCNCVLGQIGQQQIVKVSYSEIVPKFVNEDGRIRLGSYYGFDFDRHLGKLYCSADAVELYASLQSIWKRVIRKRRKEIEL